MAAHAAEGYSHATGRVGVCLATSGPGATNLVTGIADAFHDRVPLLAVPRAPLRRHRPLRPPRPAPAGRGVRMPRVAASTATELDAATERVLAHTGSPVVVDVRVCAELDVFPMVPAGATLSDMLESAGPPPSRVVGGAWD